MKKYAVLLVLALLSFQKSFSQAIEIPPIDIDRSNFSLTPSLTPKGYVQVESGVVAESINDNFFLTTPSLLMKYGANKKFELRLQTALKWNEGTNANLGVPPVEIGIKTSLIDAKGALPRVSFIGHLALDGVATDNYQAKYVAPKFRFAFQHTLAKKVLLGYNLGMEWNGYNAVPDMIYTICTWYAITDKLACFVELFGNKNNYSTANHHADAGFIFLSGQNSMLDISGGVRGYEAGTFGVGSYYYATLGYSFRFNTSKKVETIFVR